MDDIFDEEQTQETPAPTGPEKKPCPACGKMLTWTQAGKPRSHKCEPKEPAISSEPESNGETIQSHGQSDQPKGITVNQVINAYMSTKAKIAVQEAALAEELKPLKERMDKFLTYLAEKMKADGVTSINGQLGRSEFYPVTSAKVEDPIIFLKWVHEDWECRKHFLENRVSKTAVKDLMDDGQVPPPGVGYTKIQKVKVVKK